MRNIYNSAHHNEHFSVKEFREELEQFAYEGMNIKNVMYMYDLLGFLSEFRVTAKGISAIDSMGNYCYFPITRKRMQFYKDCCFYADS